MVLEDLSLLVGFMEHTIALSSCLALCLQASHQSCWAEVASVELPIHEQCQGSTVMGPTPMLQPLTSTMFVMNLPLNNPCLHCMAHVKTKNNNKNKSTTMWCVHKTCCKRHPALPPYSACRIEGVQIQGAQQHHLEKTFHLAAHNVQEHTITPWQNDPTKIVFSTYRFTLYWQHNRLPPLLHTPLVLLALT